MSSKIVELREQMRGLKSQAEAIQQDAIKDNEREPYEEEVAKIHSLVDLAEEKQAEIERLEAEAANQRVTALGETLEIPLPRKTVTGSQGFAIPKDPDKELKHGYANMGAFAFSVMEACTPGSTVARDDRLLIGATATGMQQTVGSDGGFLVPPAFSKVIWDGLNAQPDNLLAMTDKYTVDGDSLTFNANAETSRVTGSRYGGVQAYWIAEADQATSSRPKFRQLKLEPHQLAVLVYATDKLLKNGTAVEQYITRAAIDEINFMVGDAIINGNGVGKPQGILNSGCTVRVDKEVGQVAKTIEAENITNMWSRLHARSRLNAVWFINQDIEPQLQTMSIGVGTAGQPVYLQPGQFSEAPFARLYGRPVMPIEYCATLGTIGDIILADLSAYATGTQGGIETGMSIHLRFDYLESAFRFVFAIDGRSWLKDALTPFKGTNTQSTFVKLQTRA